MSTTVIPNPADRVRSYIHAARYSAEEKYAPREWVVRDLLAMGTLNGWIGPEKSRKSCFALLLAMHIASGRDWYGFSVPESRSVVYFSAEDPSDEIDLRYKAMLAQFTDQERKLIAQNLTVIKGREWFVSKGVGITTENGSFWKEFAATYPAQVYVLDALEMFHTGCSNDEMRDTLIKLRRFCGPDNCLVILHHTRKRDDREIAGKQPMRLRKVGVRTWSDKALGAGALKRIADVIVCQEFCEDRQPGDNPTETAVIDEWTDLAAFGKIIEDVPLMTFEDNGLYTYEFVTKLSDAARESLLRLRQKRGPWASRNAAAKELGLSRSQANLHIREMVRKGWLRVDAAGQVNLV